MLSTCEAVAKAPGWKKRKDLCKEKGEFPKTLSQKCSILREQNYTEEFHGSGLNLLVQTKVEITCNLKWKLELQNVLNESTLLSWETPFDL